MEWHKSHVFSALVLLGIAVIVIDVGGGITFVALEDFALKCSAATLIIIAVAITIRMTTPLIIPPIMASADPVLVLMVVTVVSEKKNNNEK